jgi:hypothetical protein
MQTLAVFNLRLTWCAVISIQFLYLRRLHSLSLTICPSKLDGMQTNSVDTGLPISPRPLQQNPALHRPRSYRHVQTYCICLAFILGDEDQRRPRQDVHRPRASSDHDCRTKTFLHAETHANPTRERRGESLFAASNNTPANSLPSRRRGICDFFICREGSNGCEPPPQGARRQSGG